MKIGITEYAEKYIEEHTTRKKYYSEESYNKIKQKLEAYENMRKEAIEYIEHAKFIREQVILKRSYALQDFQVKDLLNILNKVGEDNE
jgi:hypothetical protein